MCLGVDGRLRPREAFVFKQTLLASGHLTSQGLSFLICALGTALLVLLSFGAREWPEAWEKGSEGLGDGGVRTSPGQGSTCLGPDDGGLGFSICSMGLVAVPAWEGPVESPQCGSWHTCSA